jgi:hypothetical protein
MAKRQLSRAEVIKANNLFEQALEKLEGGFVRYKDNWSDAKIASLIDPSILHSTIGNLRVELHGKFKNQSGGHNQNVKELETVVKNLLECYQNLEGRYNKLIDTLALNKVANVAHLKTNIEVKKV